jgi:hypothetical protein
LAKSESAGVTIEVSLLLALNGGFRGIFASMAYPSPIMAMYLEAFKAAAGEGAALELKMRLLAGKIPALRKYVHERELAEIETAILREFDASLTADEKETLRLSRQLRNKVLHSDFRAARKKLNETRGTDGIGWDQED